MQIPSSLAEISGSAPASYRHERDQRSLQLGRSGKYLWIHTDLVALQGFGFMFFIKVREIWYLIIKGGRCLGKNG